MSIFGWLGKKLFGFDASPEAVKWLDDSAQLASDYLDKLQEQSRPVPLPYAAVEHQRKQAAAAAKPFPYPPTCPESDPPSSPPSAPPPWHQASVHYEVDHPSYPPVSLPLTPRPLPTPYSSTGPPPPMSPPPPLPIPPQAPLPRLPGAPLLPVIPAPPPPRPSRPPRRRHR